MYRRCDDDDTMDDACAVCVVRADRAPGLCAARVRARGSLGAAPCVRRVHPHMTYLSTLLFVCLCMYSL
jgi:hypothetical protein